MMTVNLYIHDLLYKHDCVIIPTFGAFVVNYSSAKIHPVLNTFSPPSKYIIFNSNLKHNDGLLASSISENEGITFEEAAEKINSFVAEFKEKIKYNKQVTIEGIGSFQITEEGSHSFLGDSSINFLANSFGFNDFVSPSIKREDLKQRLERKFADRRIVHSERKKRRPYLKIAATVLPIAAIITWAFFNIDSFKNTYSNFSSLFPFDKNSGKVVSVKNTIDYSKFPVYSLFKTSINDEDLVELAENFIYTPSEISLKKTNSQIDVVQLHKPEPKQASAINNNEDDKFFIIGSCFKIKENAYNFHASLINKGFSGAGIINPPQEGGLYKVYMCAYNSPDEADNALSNFKKENPNVWIFKSSK